MNYGTILQEFYKILQTSNSFHYPYDVVQILVYVVTVDIWSRLYNKCLHLYLLLFIFFTNYSFKIKWCYYFRFYIHMNNLMNSQNDQNISHISRRTYWTSKETRKRLHLEMFRIKLLRFGPQNGTLQFQQKKSSSAHILVCLISTRCVESFQRNKNMKWQQISGIYKFLFLRGVIPKKIKENKWNSYEFAIKKKSNLFQ